MVDDEFWKSCCERGIAIYPMPKPFDEAVKVWCIAKQTTVIDRKKWAASYTRPTLEDAIDATREYFKTGVEPWRVENVKYKLAKED